MLLRFLVATGSALLLAATAVHAQTQPLEDRWTFSVTPYLWLPNMNGTFKYSTPSGATASPEVEITPNDYLSNLQAVFPVAGSAQKGRWGVFTDILYLGFDSQESAVKAVNFGPGRLPISASVSQSTSSELKALEWTLAGSYSLLEKHHGALDVIGGLRYMGLETTTNWNVSATITAPGGGTTFAQSGSISERADLWDGIIGLRGRIPFGESAWALSYYGDIGAGTESSTTYQWLLGINYDFKWGGLILAYRELDYDQSSDELVQNLKFGGPALGVTFRF